MVNFDSFAYSALSGIPRGLPLLIGYVVDREIAADAAHE
jgi:hypothetical protein